MKDLSSAEAAHTTGLMPADRYGEIGAFMDGEVRVIGCEIQVNQGDAAYQQATSYSLHEMQKAEMLTGRDTCSKQCACDCRGLAVVQ